MVMVPNLQMNKLGPKEVKRLAKGEGIMHKALYMKVFCSCVQSHHVNCFHGQIKGEDDELKKISLL